MRTNMEQQTAIDDRAQALDRFAAAAAPRDLPAAPLGSAAPGFAHAATGAIAVAVRRDVHRVLTTIKALASAAGEDWYYRFPVRDKKKGTTSFIEGPSIKLANDLAREYGNCEVDTRVIDLGREWLIYARFTDLETGFSLTRPFQQNKAASRLGGDDDARRLDIALQIGTSKAIRNVVVNALQTYADEAFQAAKNSLVERIGRDLAGWRTRTVERLGQQIDTKRVEHVIGRVAKDWLAPDVAKVIAMMRAVSEGMASLDETFPPIANAEPAAPATASPTVETFAAGETTEQKDRRGRKGQAKSEANAKIQPGPVPETAAEQPEEAPGDAGAADAADGDGGGADGAPAQEPVPDAVALAETRTAGARARAQGRARGAVPDVYQADARLVAAYHAGWDGAPGK